MIDVDHEGAHELVMEFSVTDASLDNVVGFVLNDMVLWMPDNYAVCEDWQVCLDILEFTPLRGSNQLQRQCLEADEQELSIMSETCKKWRECLSKSGGAHGAHLLDILE